MRALVLSGGGARGAWQAGAIKRLAEQGKTWDLVVGTSVGAVNAAGLAYLGAEKMSDLWLKLKGRSDVMKLNLTWPWNFDGLYSFDPLRWLLKSLIVGDPVIESVACRINSRDISVHYVSCKNVGLPDYLEAIVGSCVVSGIQSPSQGVWIDGGHRQFAPLNYAIDRGAIQIDIISTEPISDDLPAQERPKMWFPIRWQIGQGLSALAHEVWLRDLDRAQQSGLMVEVHTPAIPLNLDPLDYRPEKLKLFYNLGYQSDVKTIMRAQS